MNTRYMYVRTSVRPSYSLSAFLDITRDRLKLYLARVLLTVVFVRTIEIVG